MTGAAVPFVRRVQRPGVPVDRGMRRAPRAVDRAARLQRLRQDQLPRRTAFRQGRALQTPQQAIASRGGLAPLLHRTSDSQAGSFTISLVLGLQVPGAGEVEAGYGFETGPGPAGEAPWRVLWETGVVELPGGPVSVEQGQHRQTGRLLLPVSTTDDESPLSILEAALSSMRFYELESGRLTGLEEPAPGQPYLGQGGEQLGPVLGALAREAQWARSGWTRTWRRSYPELSGWTSGGRGAIPLCRRGSGPETAGWRPSSGGSYPRERCAPPGCWPRPELPGGGAGR